jgi:hypothetical protein
MLMLCTAKVQKLAGMHKIIVKTVKIVIKLATFHDYVDKSVNMVYNYSIWQRHLMYTIK